jgi:hypothetical protein
MKKLSLIPLFIFLCLVLFSQDENELLTQFSSRDVTEIDFNQSDDKDVSDKEEGFSYKSAIYSVREIDRRLENKRQIDHYYQQRSILKAELSLIDSLARSKSFNELNAYLEGWYFKKVRKTYPYSSALQEGDELEIIGIDGDFYLTDEFEKYINENYPGWPSLEEEIENYQYLNELFNVIIMAVQAYKIEVDPWDIYGNDPVKYSDELLRMIRQLLEEYSLLECTYDEYMNFEKSQNISTINKLISFRYSFFKHCYEKIN